MKNARTARSAPSARNRDGGRWPIARRFIVNLPGRFQASAARSCVGSSGVVIRHRAAGNWAPREPPIRPGGGYTGRRQACARKEERKMVTADLSVTGAAGDGDRSGTGGRTGGSCRCTAYGCSDPSRRRDAVPETMRPPGNGIAGSLRTRVARTWLYKIATSRCLNARRRRAPPARERDVLQFEPPVPTPRGRAPAAAVSLRLLEAPSECRPAGGPLRAGRSHLAAFGPPCSCCRRARSPSLILRDFPIPAASAGMLEVKRRVGQQRP